MNKGEIKFRASIKGNGLKFTPVDFSPGETRIEKIEIESPNGDEIQGTVYIGAVATDEEARTIAAEIITNVLDRLSFRHNVAIGTNSITSRVLIPLNTQAGEMVQIHTADALIFGGEVTAIASIASSAIKGELERGTYPGERWFGLFRSALQSEGPVEKYMSLYHILSILFNDKQQRVDDFIRNQDPMVSQSGRPDKPEIIETIYSRLRNEFAHRRSGVNINDTKVAMAQRWINLAALTKRAIELHP
jgi:hypothetical protein